MQRSSGDGQMSGHEEPTQEPSDALSSESSQETLLVSEKKVVQLEDFDYVNFADAEFSSDEIEDFKKLYLGKQLPRQRASNEKLRAVGFKGPNPWAACWLERRIMNS